MKISAVIPAAGLGLRFKSPLIKPLVLLDGQAIIIHTLKNISSHPLINEIILVFNKEYISDIKNLIKKNNIKKISRIIAGGKTRKDSVYKGLKSLSSATQLVLIHDGVRPFLDHKIITKVIRVASRTGAAVVGVPVKSTLKKIDIRKLKVSSTLNRNEIWEIQTPQVFKKGLILKAYKKSCEASVCDDSFLVEKLKQPVFLVKGSYFNIKITTPEDLVLAREINRQFNR